MSICDFEETSQVESSEIFMLREYWVPSKQAKACQSCQASFDFLTRKHHCRMCGNIFDYKCCGNFLNPPEFTFEDEQKIRVCNGCYRRAQLYFQEGQLRSKRGPIFQSFVPSFMSEDSKSSLEHLLSQRAYELSNNALEFLLKEEGLCDNWYGILKALVKDCMEKIQANITYSDDLDINRFIKVKTIPYQSEALTRIVMGVVVRKNILNKKMKNDFSNPNILMINGDLEFHATELIMVDSPLIEDENIFFDTVINKILELKPQIVIVEGRVNRVIHEALIDAGITIIAKMRKTQFMRIAEAIGIKPLEDSSKIESASLRDLGCCQKFGTLNFKNRRFYEERGISMPDETPGSFDPTLMTFELGNKGKNITILLSGPDVGILKKLKKCLKVFFPIFRTLLLEKGVIHQEISLFNPQKRIWKLLAAGTETTGLSIREDFQNKFTIQNYKLESLKEITSAACLLNESTTATVGYMLRYLTERETMKDLISKDKMSFSKFTLVPINYETIPDLQKIKASDKAKMEKELKTSNCWHRTQMCQVEKDCCVIECYFCGEHDITIGSFLKERSSRAVKTCSTCSRAYHSHVEYFLAGDLYIKIESGFKNGTGESKGKGLFNSVMGGLMPALTQNSFVNLGAQSSTKSNPSVMISDPNSSECFNMYLQCSKCLNRLSDIIQLNKDYLEYSFTRYLESLVWSAHENSSHFPNQSSNQFSSENIPRRPNIRPCCVHSPKNRVFMNKGFSLKLRVGHFVAYSFTSIDYRDPGFNQIIKMTEKTLVIQKKIGLNEVQREYLSISIENMKRVLYHLTGSSDLDSILKRSQLEEKAEKDYALTRKDLYNILISNVLRIYEKLSSLLEEVDKDLEKKANHHLEVDQWGREFYEEIQEMTVDVEIIKNNYQTILEETGLMSPDKEDDLSFSQNGMGHQNMASTAQSIDVYDKSGIFEMTRKYVVRKDSEKLQDRLTYGISDDPNTEILSLDKELELTEKLTAGIFATYDNYEIPESIHYERMPFFESRVSSIIAFSLNSPQYMKKVYKEGGFFENELYTKLNRDSPNYYVLKEFVDSKLSSVDLEYSDPFILTIPPFQFKVKYLNHLLATIPNNQGNTPSIGGCNSPINLDILEDFVGFIDTKSLAQGTCSNNFTTTQHVVTCHYPVQFEAVRAYNGIDLRDYISSLSASEAWDDNTGGKTGASFTKTYDQRFVFKEIEKKEFSMLLDFLPSYFEYIWSAYNSGTNSLLIKIFGVYEIVTEKRSIYLFAMENLFFGMTPNVKVYDLKGSQLNRFMVKEEGKRQTLLDTNYKIDRNGEPLPIKEEFYKLIDEEIQKDSRFLAEQKKMDYSLLVIYDEKEKVLRMGIIDYLRDFDLEKHLEYYGKMLIKGSTPTTTPPENYKHRFRKAMKQYFIAVQEQ